jgi:hypothetical protein
MIRGCASLILQRRERKSRDLEETLTDIGNFSYALRRIEMDAKTLQR